MKKIRINELARELEVKAHEILERLPELGVTEKKTHSSSIDEDVAIRLRRLYGVETPEEAPTSDGDGAARPEMERHEDGAAQPAIESAAPSAAEAGGPPPSTAPTAADEHVPAAGPRTPLPEETGGPERPVAPIRPPLAGRPLHPPVGRMGSPVVTPAAPVPTIPVAPSTPAVHPPPAAPRPEAPTPPAAVI